MPVPQVNGMRVISKRRLREFWERHVQAERGLTAWYNVALRAEWKSLADVRRDYSHADLDDDGLTVFNISGNKYRLSVDIYYKGKQIYIKKVETHAEYDKGNKK